jgi:hypothetical protein
VAVPLTAQGRIAVVPFAGYGLPGSLAEDAGNDIHFEPNGALLLGAALELGVNKNIGIAVGVNRTFSQKLDLQAGGSSQGEEDFTMTQLSGSIVIRPAGRLPSGAVSPLFIEVGGGVTLYTLGSAAFPAEDFDATSPMAFVGAGYNIPMGPRATIQVFARAQMISSYSSTGLDAFNAAPPPTSVEGSNLLNFQFGAGLRVGR